MHPFHFPALHPLDLTIVIAYLCANMLAGLLVLRRNRGQGAEEYILAGRTLTLPAFIATLVSTWYGGIIGVGEFSYENGIVMWVVFGVPYYLAAIVYAFLLAHRINKDRANATIPDRLRATYGEKAGYIGAVATFLMTSPASYILMLATLYEWYFGFSLWMAVALAISSSTIYLYFGGFRASIRADVLQFVVMFLGFAIVVPFAWNALGSPTDAFAKLPAGHLEPFGGFSVWFVAIWYIGALTTLVDPNVATRVFAARSPKVAKQGLLLSVGCWLLFDLMTNAAGLYARVAFASLPESKYAYPALAELVLPVGLKGIFYTGLLATVISTVDSFFFMSATIAGRDILWRWRGKGNEALVKPYVRLGLFITAITSIAVVMMTGKIYLVWYAMSSVLVPTLLLPLTLSYFPQWRPTPRRASIAMIAAGLGAILAFIGGVARMDETGLRYVLGVEPMYIGLAISTVLLTPAGLTAWTERRSR